MPMKLLSFTERKDSQQKEQTIKILRTQEVNDLAKTANANLARAEADFNATLAKNRAKWAIEENDHADRIKSMTGEIEALERRKEQALIPISLYKKEADALMGEAQEIVKKAQTKEDQVDFILEKLETELTAVADREQAVTEKENKLESAMKGVEAQQEITKKGAEALYEQTVLFQQKQEKEEASLLERKKEVSLAEITFQAKVDKYKRDMEALRVWDLQLKDERETLKRAMERL